MSSVAETSNGRYVGRVSGLCDEHAREVGTEAAILSDVLPPDLLADRLATIVADARDRCRASCGRAVVEVPA